MEGVPMPVLTAIVSFDFSFGASMEVAISFLSFFDFLAFSFNSFSFLAHSMSE
jgi:hypothetical protein